MARMREIGELKVKGPELPKEKYDCLEEFILGLETKKGALIEVLHKAQEIFGYLPMEVQLYIARKLGIPGAEVFGVVSFYSFFKTKPEGKHLISICMGTACFVKGSAKIMDRFRQELGVELGQTTEDGNFTLKDVRCIGACNLAPVVMVDGKIYGRCTEENVAKILEEWRRADDGSNIEAAPNRAEQSVR